MALIRILRTLPQGSAKPAPRPRIAYETTNLNLSLLKSSPPNPVKLSILNKRFTESLREYPDVVSPVRRYAD
jgi:hypothetical protein